MKPSDFRMRAISPLIREAGTATESCRAACAFRMRVSMSAIGSVIMGGRPLPARLDDARDLAPERQRAETDAAESELPDERTRPPAEVAAVVLLHLEFRRALRLDDHRRLGHVVSAP